MIKLIFLIILISLTGFSYGQVSSELIYEVNILNYSETDCIDKLKKLELGVKLDSELTKRIKAYLNNPYPAGTKNSWKINPFLDWSLDIEAIFTHAESNTSKKRDFFYYHDFEQVENDWSDAVNKVNEYIMRVRFAPPEAGLWSTKITIKVNDSIVAELSPFEFNVCENTHPGYAEVHQNKRNIERGEKIVFPLGHVFPGPYNRVASDSKMPWGDPVSSNKNSNVQDWNAFHEDIKSYVSMGGKSIKLIQTSYGNLLEFEELGNYLPRMHYAWEQDKIIDYCEENDVLINFNLLFQDVIMAYGQNGSRKGDEMGGGFWGDPWDYGNYASDSKTRANPNDYYKTYCYFVPGELPSHMFLTDSLMSYHKQRTRYYVSRYGYSPQIYTWELMSEPFHMNEYSGNKIQVGEESLSDAPAVEENHPGHELAINAINRYHNQISEYMKGDLGSEQLITLNIAAIEIEDDFYLQSATNSNIDLLGLNLYSPNPKKQVLSKLKNNKGKKNLELQHERGAKESSQYKFITNLSLKYGKPLILSEIGHGWPDEFCLGTTGNIIDGMTYGFSGIAAMHPWSGYSYGGSNEFDSRLLWPSSISSEKHMNSEKVIPVLNNLDGKWMQGRQVAKIHRSNIESPKEIQYYLSQNNELASGYVRNRSFNAWTNRTKETCTLDRPGGFRFPLDNLYPFNWDDGNKYLYVTGLQKKANYKVYWYEYKTGELFHTQYQKTNGKSRMKLEFPYLNLEMPLRPILWFSIEKIVE